MASFAARLQGGAYLAAAANGAYNFGTGDFTLEAWIRASGPGTILSRKATGGGQGSGGWLLVLQPDGGVKLATDNGFGFYQVISQARPVVDGQWHHVAAVRMGGAMSIYVDGAPVPVTPSGSVGTPADVNNSLRLLAGAADQAQEPYNRFTGDLDELRVWNVARSAAQIQQWMRQPLTLPQGGLVGYWTFADRSLGDSSATGNAFTAQGSVDFAQPSALGTATWAVQLASSAYLAAGSSGAYNFGTGGFTFEAWVRARGAGTILSRKGSDGGSGNGGWLLVLQPNGALKLATDSGFGYYQAISQAKPIVDGQWHHVAGVRSGGTLTIYVDGAAVPSSPSGNTGSPTNVNNSLRLLAGATDQRQEAYNRLNGDLDELRVWNVARTAQQIAAYWNQPLPLPQQGLVGYWTFDAASYADSSPTGNGFAPQGAATLITPGAPLAGATLAAPTLQQTAYDGVRVTAQWTAVSDPRLTGYTLAVFADGAQVASAPVAAGQTTGSVTVQLDPARACTAQVQAVAGSVVSDWSAAKPVIAGAPALTAVGYDGATVSASWSAVTGASSYTMTVYDGSTAVRTVNTTGTHGTVAAQLDPAKSYTVRVRGANGPNTGPESAPGTVITGVPTISAVAYDGASVSATWSAVPGASGYTMAVYAGNTVVASVAVAGTQGSVAARLDPTRTYTVGVTATNGVSSGPRSAAVVIVTAVTAITSVTYDGTSVSAVWSPLTGVVGYTLTVYDASTPVGSSTTGETHGLVAATLDPTKTYTARVRAANGASSGPESEAVTVLAGAPAIASAGYDGTAVSATWSAVAGASGYTMVVYDGTAAVVSGTATGTQGTLAARLDPGKAYTLRVAATNGSSSGPQSAAAPVVAGAPVIDTVTYDGANVFASWAGVTGATGYTLTVYDGTTVVGTANTTEPQGSVAAQLDPARSYTVRVRATNGTSSGPESAAVSVIVGAPVLQSVSYDGTAVAANWSAVTGAAGYTLTVYDGTTPVGTVNTTVTQGSVAAQLDPTRSYTVSVRATDGVSGGPASAAVAVIAAAPTIATVAYDGTAVSASWSAVTGATGYVLALYEGTTTLRVIDTGETQGSIPATLDPTKTYTVRVHATGTGTSGPQSAPVAVIAAAPTFSTVAYDGASVSASWSAVTGATGYTLTVYDGTTAVASANTAGTQGSVAAQLDPTRSYTVSVRATDGVSGGPASAAVAVIAAAPTIATVAYDGTNVSASWSAVTGVSGYTLTVFDGTTAVSSANTAETQGSVAAQLDPTKGYTVGVRATNGTSSGPESAAVTVIAAAPVVASVTWDGTSVGASWAAVPGATGYTMTVYDGTTAVGTADTAETQGSIAATLDPTKTYTVRVRATAAASSGPESTPVTVIVGAPTLASVAYDGTSVTASWSAVTGATGYTLTVYDGTTAVASANAAGTQGSVAAQLDPTRSYTVGVRATDGVSGGPASAAVAVIAAAPTIATVAYDGTNVSASWSAVTGASGYTLTVFDGTTAVSSANTAETQGSVAAQLDPTKSYTVGVRATNGTSSGPESAAVTVIAAAPVVASVTWDGTSVGASWAAVPGATGYTMTVYDGTTVVGTADTAETQGSVTTTLDPAKTYTVRVRATATASSGPESTPVTVITGAPTLSSVAYDGAGVTAAWSAVADATGYTLSVHDGTTVVGSADTTETQGSVAAQLDPSKTYTVSVRATNGASSGPESEAVTVLTVAPTAMQLDYDGTALVAGWQAVEGAPGYTAALLADGAPVETQPATGTTATFAQTMASGVVYTARARVSAPPALGPWSDPATGPYLAAVSYVYDPLGRLTSMAMPGVTLGYTYDDAGNVLTATRTLPSEGDAPAQPTPDASTP